MSDRAADIRCRLAEIEDEIACCESTAEDDECGNEAEIDDLLVEKADLTDELRELED